MGLSFYRGPVFDYNIPMKSPISTSLFRICVLSLCGFITLSAAAQPEDIPTKTIAESWVSYGMGVVRHQNRMVFMQEAEDTKGVGVMSPEAYGENVVLRFDIMPMTPAAVCVAVLSASNQDDGSLVIPEDYDGGIGMWTRDSNNYFFAFHNMAHDTTPFIRRFQPEFTQFAIAENNVMQVGKFHTVEVGRNGARLWLEVDGVRLLEAEDPDPLPGGHIGFRIRGINGMQAACLIRNVSVVTGEAVSEL